MLATCYAYLPVILVTLIGILLFIVIRCQTSSKSEIFSRCEATRSLLWANDNSLQGYDYKQSQIKFKHISNFVYRF